LSPKGGGSPKGEIADAINKKYGSFDKFKEEFSKKAATLFGSGWTWLVKTKSGDLDIIQAQNADNPITEGHTPLLTCDVWEHAYYLDKQNRKPAYVDDFWNIVNWEKVNERYIEN